MPTRKAEAEWQGNLAEGSGNLKVGSGAFSGPYSFKSRFEEGEAATNPEELIGAAHAGCFTMALTAALSRAGIKPTRIHTTANVKLEKVGEAFSITGIDLDTFTPRPSKRTGSSSGLVGVTSNSSSPSSRTTWTGIPGSTRRRCRVARESAWSPPSK